ncbi:cucumber peeling cupredoxin-like [Alnus glutinosa]|uniref:cucumber peeling cupredoxin-like n=1 Tax=Alnus glutinosa TaxID=3517 RepID=UPI002D775971|nr:cucumber peeling cupredoxin-like [Alnus glutinosa]
MDKFIISVVIVLAAMLLQCSEAQIVHVVGDGMGWSVPQAGAAAYQTWADNNKFLVGDILTFNFATGEHDVLRVPKESFDSCSSANPIGDTITTGPVNITLSNAGNHYYICTVGQHCQFGQKLAITVSGSPTPTTPPSPQTTPPTTPSPSSGTPAPCTPTPTSSPAASPKAGGPTGQTPTPPDSSSSGVFASFFVSLLPIAAAFLF